MSKPNLEDVLLALATSQQKVAEAIDGLGKKMESLEEAVKAGRLDPAKLQATTSGIASRMTVVTTEGKEPGMPGGPLTDPLKNHPAEIAKLDKLNAGVSRG